MDSDLTFIAILIAIGATATVWDVVQLLRQHRHWRRSVAAARPAPPQPSTLEGVLARQVLDGVITAGQYRRAMTATALREATRRPLDLPPDLGPPRLR